MTDIDSTLVREKLRQYICQDILSDADYPLTDDQALLTGGLIDSFYFIQIALFIEENFAVIIPDEQLTIENMDSINKIAQYLSCSADEVASV